MRGGRWAPCGCGLWGWSTLFAPVASATRAPTSRSTPAPVLLMVKVRVTRPLLISTVPKSVWSVALGVVSPLAMVVALPLTAMIGLTLPVPEIA